MGRNVARPRHLSKAPITEAVIDLRVERAPELNFEVLGAMLRSADFGYYVKGPISTGSFEAKLTEGGKAEWTAASQPVGFRLHSRDEKYVAQWQLEGFTLSRLQPYPDWVTFVAEARRIWDTYQDRVKPTRITRLATRFINELRLPLAPGGSFQDYLEELVELPKAVPQEVEAFLQRFQVRDVNLNARVVLTAALADGRLDGKVPIIIDVDAIMERSLIPTDERLWEQLEQLHQLKNRVFFGVITEKTAEMYE